MIEGSQSSDDLDAAVELLAGDRESGATALVGRAIDILRVARQLGELRVLETARAVCAAQPSMASIWNAACAAIGPEGDRRLARFEARVRRAPGTLARIAAGLLTTPPRGQASRRLVTCSASGSVLACLTSIAARLPLIVACAEGRPRLEGRRLALQLAEAGVEVELFSDAGVAVALTEADSVLVGADAVWPAGFLNKCGTSALAAAAFQRGVPFFVAAGRDKFAGPAIAWRLRPGRGDPREIWDQPAAGISVRNPYFDCTSLELVTAFITDVGVIAPADVASVCLAVENDVGGSTCASLL